MTNGIVCRACFEPMIGPQQTCDCSFICDCFPNMRRSLTGSVVASGMRWCKRCAPNVEPDEPTLVDGPALNMDEEPTREVLAQTEGVGTWR